MSVPSYLDYGALGAAIFVLLVAVAVLFRVLQWAQSLFATVLSRIQANTEALTTLAERLDDVEPAEPTEGRS